MYNYWYDFIELGRKRGSNENGDCPITFLDIDAWCRITGVTVSQLWLDIIDMLDKTWLSVQRSK